MIDLNEYYLNKFYKHEYYLKKIGIITLDSIEKDNIIYDDIEAIDTFKELLLPYNLSNPYIDTKLDHKFILLCFYLNDNGYYIEQIPNYLERPTNRWDLSYNIIRERIIKERGTSGKVTWEERRIYVDKLKILKKEYFEISDESEKILREVSTRDAKFIAMEIDEKLEAICNSIEYLLKPSEKGDYVDIDYSDSNDYLSNEIVMKFRSDLQCFRHSTKKHLEKRKQISEYTKNFYIKFGLVIIDYIIKKKDN